MPDSLSETDALRCSLALERIASAAARLELERARLEHLRLEMSLRYSLGPRDTLDYGTGIITRESAAPPKLSTVK